MQVYDTRLIRSGQFVALAVSLAMLFLAAPMSTAVAAGRPQEAAAPAVQEVPVDPARDLFRQALEAARGGQWPAARTLAESGLGLAPEDPDGRNLLGEILVQLGDPAGARAAFEAASVADPEWVVPVRNLARMLFGSEQYREAIPVIERGIALAPDQPDLRAWLGVAHRSEGSYAQARLAFERAWQLDPDSMELAVDVALARVDVGDDEGALEAARRATEIAPDRAGPWMLLGDILARSGADGTRADAPGAYRRAIAIAPADPIPWMRLASAYGILSLHSEAETALHQAIELGADGARVYLMLARSLVSQSRPVEAIEFFSQVIALVPAGADAFLDRGQALFNANRHEEAVEDIRRAIELAPTSTEALFTGARILMVMGRIDDAIALAEQAVGLQSDPVQADLTLGRLLVRGGRSADAIAPLERVLATAPDVIEASYLLGQALLATGETERGQTLLAGYQEALRSQRAAESVELQEGVSDRARVHMLRGRVFVGEERFADARQQLEAAVELQPDLVDAWQILVLTYERLGLTDEAAAARIRVAELTTAGPVP